MSPINIASPDSAILSEPARCKDVQRAGSLAEFRDILEQHCVSGISSPTLDLIGHSTSRHHLLRLGDTPIDLLDPAVALFFRELAMTDLLSRLGIGSVRLLGCETAVTDSGRRTLRMLAHTLRVPVLGTRKILLRSHFNSDGFDPAFTGLLQDGGRISELFQSGHWSGGAGGVRNA
ncbi:hypothetical protein ACWCQZ_47960 [Streptomyces sp. NPDC002285]